MIGAICAEGALRNDYLHEDIATVYFGGGTPSLITIYDLRFTIASPLSACGSFRGAYGTVECNDVWLCSSARKSKIENRKSDGGAL